MLTCFQWFKKSRNLAKSKTQRSKFVKKYKLSSLDYIHLLFLRLKCYNLFIPNPTLFFDCQVNQKITRITQKTKKTLHISCISTTFFSIKTTHPSTQTHHQIPLHLIYINTVAINTKNNTNSIISSLFHIC